MKNLVLSSINSLGRTSSYTFNELLETILGKDQLTAIVCEKLNDYQVRKDLDIKIFVSKFYGTTDGNVTIEMNVGTTLKGKPYFDKIYSFNEVQAEDGYASLVETLKKGFFNLSANLAQDLSLKD